MSLIIAETYPNKDYPIMLRTGPRHPNWTISLEDAIDLYESLGKAISEVKYQMIRDADPRINKKVETRQSMTR